MGTRRRGRELTLQALYQADLLDQWGKSVFDEMVQYFQPPEPVMSFATRLFHGVLIRRIQIDTAIQHHADNWTIPRMNILDRNIMRIGTYEIIFCQDIPKAVSIHEAIELAKRYSSKDAGGFINGILDRIPVPAQSDEQQ